MLTVTARRGDAISLGWQHLKSGGTWLEFTQEKNRRRKPSVVSIPMPPELTAAIEACPSPPDSLTFLTNEWGKPYSKKAFNTAFRKWCNDAKLPERCVPHGVRKGGSKRMADQGCNEPEIMSHTGHRTSKEVQRYIRDYDRKQAAIRAANKLAAAQDNSNVRPLKLAAER